MLFTWIILLIGLIVGIIIAFQSKNTFIPVLKEYQQQINGLTFINLFTHFCLLAFLLITSIMVIGIPLYIIIFFIEGLNIGFIITIFSLIFKIKGLIFSLIFLFFTNFIFLLALFLIFPKCIEIARNIIGHFLYHKENEALILNLLIAGLIFILFALLIDLIFFFISPKILNLFHFLIT